MRLGQRHHVLWAILCVIFRRVLLVGGFIRQCCRGSCTGFVRLATWGERVGWCHPLPLQRGF